MTRGAGFRWAADLAEERWDECLAALGGHPLQSALWGASRRVAEGIEDRRWAVLEAERVVWMARLEIRRLPIHGRVAWVPRGPVSAQEGSGGAVQEEFLERLSREGFLVCFTDPYPGPVATDHKERLIGPRPRTLWVNLGAGKDAIFEQMHKKLRYGVRAAERAGVVVEESRRPDDVSEFFRLCNLVSGNKRFDLPGSEPLMQELIARTRPGAPVSAHLFVARCEGRVVSGYLSIRAGDRLHNIWNGTDRDYAKQCPGEAALWHQVAWAIDAGVRIYDQEGIDEVNNPGCYQFKKRLGGEEVELPGLRARPLGLLGQAALKLGQWTGRIG